MSQKTEISYLHKRIQTWSERANASADHSWTQTASTYTPSPHIHRSVSQAAWPAKQHTSNRLDPTLTRFPNAQKQSEPDRRRSARMSPGCAQTYWHPIGPFFWHLALFCTCQIIESIIIIEQIIILPIRLITRVILWLFLSWLTKTSNEKNIQVFNKISEIK